MMLTLGTKLMAVDDSKCYECDVRSSTGISLSNTAAYPLRLLAVKGSCFLIGDSLLDATS